MENWPSYWAGPSPDVVRHARVAPCLAVRRNPCHPRAAASGSGVMRDDLKARYGNPYPIETALFELERDQPLSMEITRALFHSARGYSESFSIYGEDAP
jgi:hypothetical protein